MNESHSEACVREPGERATSQGKLHITPAEEMPGDVCMLLRVTLSDFAPEFTVAYRWLRQTLFKAEDCNVQIHEF